MESALKNYYPDKPVLSYRKTKVEMGKVVQDIKALNYPIDVKRAAYIVFRLESANGSKGINENYCGFQADSGKWPAKFDGAISGVVEKIENGTSKKRLFLAFNDVSSCLDMLLDRLQARGLHVGGICSKINISNAIDLARAYKKSWVVGRLKRYSFNQ